MSQQVDTNTKTFETDGAFPQFARVKLDSDGKITIAGLTDKDIGTACEQSFGAGQFVAVKLRTAAGTHKAIASEAFDAGATLYTEADGKVQDTAQATAFQMATAMEAATANGDIVEILYQTHGDTAAS